MFGMSCYMEFSQENSKCVVDFMIPLSLSLSLFPSFAPPPSLSLSLSPLLRTHRYSPNGTAICVYYAGVQDISRVDKFLDTTYNTKGLFEVFNQNTFSNENSNEQTSYLQVSLFD